jgi:hypothetical protein
VTIGDAVLRDPLTFTIRELRKLQRYLLGMRGADAEANMAGLLGLLLPVHLAAALRELPGEDYAALRAAVLAELPELQRAVHPSPGWRRR